MKKFILIGSLLVGLTASAEMLPVSFMNGTYLCISNNTAATFPRSATNNFVPFSVGTNIMGGSFGPTNASGGSNQYPAVFKDVEILPDANGNLATDVAIYVAWGQVTNFVPAVKPFAGAQKLWPPVLNFTNNSSGPGIPVSLFPASVTSTNVCTVVIVASSDGYSFPLVAPLRKFQFDFGVTAANISSGELMVMTTNVPSTFLQGAKKLRILSITTDNSSSSVGITIDDMGVVQGQPGKPF